MTLIARLRVFGKYLLRSALIFSEVVVFFLHVLIVYVLCNVTIQPPEVEKVTIGHRVKVGVNHYQLGANYLKKNKFGVWEMYIEGDPYERGLIYGELAQELVQEQEDIFVDQIEQFVPSKFWQQFLRIFIGFFNADLPKYIPLENQQEIYGISQYFSSDYDHIATKYMRILNYHAAHDIGHALNDYSMVGCTSFALNGEKSADKQLLIGRNFDFYVGDEFAKNKLVLFVKPTKGYGFVSYSWAGFTGVASGLNEAGLSVTINASKSDLPTSSRTPIALLAREILQYARTIDEAVAIAKKRKTFVSETLMVSSAADKKAVLIEKSPLKTGVYVSSTDQLICSNHYQSNTFKNDPVNIQNIQESDSKYRYSRVERLLSKKSSYSAADALGILRDQKGPDNDTLGMGNPRAINQLIAHHSVLIQPEKRQFYISTSDFQLGEFIAYDLTKTFKSKQATIVDELPASIFISSKAYHQFLEFKKVKAAINAYLLFGKALHLSQKDIDQFIGNNGESYVTYELLGNYFFKKEQFQRSKHYIEIALTKELASQNTRKELEQLRKTCIQKDKE